ncbi:MAG: YdcF family protein [Vicingus serpentipes]|nr:YdcF family protein [Vicingus serpentipes]
MLLCLGLFIKNAKRKRKCYIAAVVLLYFFSNTFILDEAFRYYEERNPKALTNQQQYDAAIILGGFTTYDEGLQLEQFHSSIDRLLHGVQMYHTGKAKKIMLVGGSGSISRPNEKEGPILYNFLIKSGIPKNDIIVESQSKNTRENAVNAARILNEKFPHGQFVLVTSGYHMPRAKRCFDKVGLTVTPFSVDQYAGKRKYVLDHLFIPSASALAKWDMLFHEWFGYISYTIAGYI